MFYQSSSSYLFNMYTRLLLCDADFCETLAPRKVSALEKWRKLAVSYAQSIVEICWRLLEIHICKIIAFCLILLAVYDVLMNISRENVQI